MDYISPRKCTLVKISKNLPLIYIITCSQSSAIISQADECTMHVLFITETLQELKEMLCGENETQACMWPLYRFVKKNPRTNKVCLLKAAPIQNGNMNQDSLTKHSLQVSVPERKMAKKENETQTKKSKEKKMLGVVRCSSINSGKPNCEYLR